jgi:4-hydroxy-tetrahydrodipicolinate synthase
MRRRSSKTNPGILIDGVFAVPPLARVANARKSIDFAENERLVRHIGSGGIKRLIYGGNAFLYHIPLDEYGSLLDWLSGFASEFAIVPAAGPSYGRAIDQATLLRKYRFPCVMMLPCADPRDAAGLENGLRAIAEASEHKLLLYVKDENNFGADKEAGLDVIARLIDSGICVGIKYAIVRPNPAEDHYLESLLKRVDRSKVISGMGERPALVHLRDWELSSFTTGSGCIAPRLSAGIFASAGRGDFVEAERLRELFLPLEDLRDRWNPARVLHYAVEVAGIARAGPVLPFLSSLSESEMLALNPVVRDLLRAQDAV